MLFYETFYTHYPNEKYIFWPLILLFCCLGFVILFFSLGSANNFALESPAFKTGSILPPQYTCKGNDISPPLKWQDAPSKTQSFVLIVADPYAAFGVQTHWILFNIPPTVTSLAAGAPPPAGAISIKNNWGSSNYRGPCPPLGMHSYTFKIYALDKVLDLKDDTDRYTLLHAMEEHVIGTTELVGLFRTDWTNEESTPDFQ